MLLRIGGRYAMLFDMTEGGESAGGGAVARGGGDGGDQDEGRSVIRYLLSSLWRCMRCRHARCCTATTTPP
jgi:hypothetical protein